MSDFGDVAYRYDPDADDTPRVGVTSGHLVVWDGKPGPATMARAALLTDDEGIAHVVLTGELEPVTVVDDTPAETPDS